MKKIMQSVTIKNPIGNLYRKNHVLIMVQDEKGNFILCEKNNFYPENIWRFLGGGIEENENSRLAAIREIQEETGLKVNLADLKDVVQVETNAETTEGKFLMNTYVYFYKMEEAQLLVPDDDISGVIRVNLNEFKDLIGRMKDLSGIYHGDGFSFDWNDWATIYSFIHEKAMNWFLEKETDIKP